jgi:aspartyl-tRNA(Asn)/glutamyl-tRNA(Gln) amidotransferase subunit C
MFMSSQVDIKVMDKISRLSRIRLTTEEKEHLLPEIKQIVGLIDHIDEVNTDNVEPTISVSDHHANDRKDEILPTYREEILQNAPAQEHNCFATPKVIDEE